jgi:hypothetical protein
MAWGARGRPPDGRLISPRRLVLVSVQASGQSARGDEDEKFEPRRESWGAWTRRRRARSFVHASRDRSGVMKRVGAPGRRAHRPASRRAGETK